MPRFAVIIPAAGSSSRFGGVGSKLVQELAGLPVIARAVLPFAQRSDTDHIFIAAPSDPYAISTTGNAQAGLAPATIRPTGRANELWEALKRSPALANRLGGQIDFVPGGANRALSVASALQFVPKDVEFVAIHDAARPLVSQDLIDRTLAAAIEHGAAAPALPVNLTIKQATGPLPAKVQHTVPRAALWAMQTPQIIRRDWLESAYETCVYPLEQITDDLQLLELTGRVAWLVPGDETNIKITTPLDLRVATSMMSSC